MKKEIKIPKVRNLYSTILKRLRTDGELDMAGIRQCKTIHCTAGWIIHLAGKQGYALEEKFGWECATNMIHNKNRQNTQQANYYRLKNDEAMAYIMARAKEEKRADPIKKKTKKEN